MNVNLIEIYIMFTNIHDYKMMIHMTRIVKHFVDFLHFYNIHHHQQQQKQFDSCMNVKVESHWYV